MVGIIRRREQVKEPSFNPDDMFDENNTATEENFIQLLDHGIYDSKYIGYKVQLSQTSGYYNNGIWVIADVGHHANQPNTYDLISQDAFYRRTFSGSTPIWRNSDIRTWLNGTFYNGFSENFKYHMDNITYDSNGSTYNDDKIILPSFTEVNGTTGTTGTYFVTEGTAYPIFTDNNSRKKYQFGTSSNGYYWTRSRHTRYSDDIWHVGSDGSMSSNNFFGNYYLAPVLRIS